MAGTITHKWNGTVLTITSDSGTSSADLKGEKGDDGARGAQGSICDITVVENYVKANAAPAGYVEEIIGCYTNDDINTAITSEWAKMADNSKRYIVIGILASGLDLDGGNWHITLNQTNYAYGTLTAIKYGGNGAFMMCRDYYNSVWQPWEWVNPPMVIGKEYRTTERYKGKPVYTRIVDCGALPNASSKDVYLGDGIKGANVVDYNIKLFSASGGLHMLPWLNTSFSAQARAWISSAGYIQISTNSDMTAYTAAITLKYIKD